MIAAVDKPINQSEREENKYYLCQAQKNACEILGSSDWFRKWREICQLITEHSSTKPKLGKT